MNLNRTNKVANEDILLRELLPGNISLFNLQIFF